MVCDLDFFMLSFTNVLQSYDIGSSITRNSNFSHIYAGNVAIALQPGKSVTLTQPAQVQTITLPTINQSTSSANIQGNQSNTVATDLLNLTAAQNVTFGNILSVQQKPSSDVLVLNPTGVQLNANNVVGSNVSSTALQVAPSASNT